MILPSDCGTTFAGQRTQIGNARDRPLMFCERHKTLDQKDSLIFASSDILPRTP